MKFRDLPFGLLVVFATLILGITGCDSGGDDPKNTPEIIDGDAALTMENPMEDRYTVYFDGVFIGRVQAHSTRTWNVPSGNHTVLIDNGDRDWTEQYSGSYFFAPRLALILTIDNGPTLYIL